MTYGWLKLPCCRKLPKLLKSAELCRKLAKGPKKVEPGSQNPQRNQQSARARLAALREKKAPTKAAQIRALWPEIKAALDNGHSLKSVCDCLEGDGIKITVQTLGSYITRMRRNLATLETALPGTTSEASKIARTPAAPTTRRSTSAAEKSADPLANLRERQRKRSAFDYRPELADPKDLI